jgi:hypothetical protein
VFHSGRRCIATLALPQNKVRFLGQHTLIATHRDTTTFAMFYPLNVNIRGQ